MNFFKPNYEYIEYLHQFDQNIILSKKMFGVILRLNELIYFLPIDSVTENDYDENHNLYKNNPAILRIIVNQECIGKCLFSNMFPIPYMDLISLEINKIDMNNINLNEKKLEYIKKNIARIQKGAERLYKQKIKSYNQAYLSVTVDFKMLEKMAIKWEIEHYHKHYNRFPDSQFFLTNALDKGLSEYYLMNKNCKVAKVLFDNSQQKVVNILEIINPQFAPLECYTDGVITSEAITRWFKGRGIPSWRDGLDDFLDNIGIKNKDILLNKAFGLSLSDQYWLNPVNMLMEWKDINFFQNEFDGRDYTVAIFENRPLNSKSVNMFSPNNTSDGMLKKAWITENGKKYLLKGSYKSKGLEPFNEVLASMICNELKLSNVSYSIDNLNEVLVSKCECFINENTELLSAYSILKYYNVDMRTPSIDMYNKYLSILEEHGINNAKREVTKMFLLDYIIINTDRHLGNFGVIRNVNTLQWEGVAPNFDSGQALHSQKELFEMNFKKTSGCFFNEKEKDFDLIFDIIKENIDFEINFENLMKVAEEWKKLLFEYQQFTLMESEKIEIIYLGLVYRIDSLKIKINNNKKES